MAVKGVALHRLLQRLKQVAPTFHDLMMASLHALVILALLFVAGAFLGVMRACFD